MKDEYVKFETAKLLKEKGFDEHCHMVHINNHNSLIGKVISNSELITTHEYKFCKDQENCITIPTQQMACRWLREEKGIHIYPIPANGYYYWASIYIENSDRTLNKVLSRNGRKAYEDAIESALEYVLKNLI